MKKILTAALILALPLVGSAQMIEKVDLTSAESIGRFGSQAAPTPFSLLDLSRISWSHSYSVSYFSGGNNSGSAGLLNSTMFYEISSKLSLAVNIGVAHDPGAMFSNGQSNSTILPGFALDYHPSENFRVSVRYQKFNNGNYPNYDSGSQWHRRTNPF